MPATSRLEKKCVKVRQLNIEIIVWLNIPHHSRVNIGVGIVYEVLPMFISDSMGIQEAILD